jgi:hypothetical protein
MRVFANSQSALVNSRKPTASKRASLSLLLAYPFYLAPVVFLNLIWLDRAEACLLLAQAV